VDLDNLHPACHQESLTHLRSASVPRRPSPDYALPGLKNLTIMTCGPDEPGADIRHGPQVMIR